MWSKIRSTGMGIYKYPTFIAIGWYAVISSSSSCTTSCRKSTATTGTKSTGRSKAPNSSANRNSSNPSKAPALNTCSSRRPTRTPASARTRLTDRSC